jgi:tagatose-1,6-bisphosphate aldolase
VSYSREQKGLEAACDPREVIAVVAIDQQSALRSLFAQEHGNRAGECSWRKVDSI